MSHTGLGPGAQGAGRTVPGTHPPTAAVTTVLWTVCSPAVSPACQVCGGRVCTTNPRGQGQGFLGRHAWGLAHAGTWQSARKSSADPALRKDKTRSRGRRTGKSVRFCLLRDGGSRGRSGGQGSEGGPQSPRPCPSWLWAPTVRGDPSRYRGATGGWVLSPRSCPVSPRSST